MTMLTVNEIDLYIGLPQIVFTEHITNLNMLVVTPCGISGNCFYLLFYIYTL